VQDRVLESSSVRYDTVWYDARYLSLVYDTLVCMRYIRS